MADSALSESGKALVEVVKKKWLEKSDAAKAVVAEAAVAPADPDNRDAVLAQLRKALKADPEFAAEVSRLAASGGVTIHGDSNKVAYVEGNFNDIKIS